MGHGATWQIGDQQLPDGNRKLVQIDNDLTGSPPNNGLFTVGGLH
jgi:hypothetical protein